jgi:formate hydrogenlyase subunit 3/multisubunit Na+/H+ antiporter MnhD subunit
VNLLLAALLVWICGGVASLAGGRDRHFAGLLGASTAVTGSLLALLAGLQWVITAPAVPWQVNSAWPLPIGKLALCCDPLAVLFVAATALVTGLAAIYGTGYLRHAPAGRSFGLCWCLFNLLTASMTLVFLASHALLFLLAWEGMALTSFGLVLFDHERPGVRRAGVVYFLATHLGTALLLVMFLLLGRETGGSLEFAAFRELLLPAGVAGTVFVLAVLGFGTKAGLMPMHVWLPEAHPAAPSHVSAVMSGVMIKTGIYGIARILTFLDAPPAWWGWMLITLGGASALFGILLALAQRDLKRMLAYSSVENIGIICMGMGLGLIGITTENAVLATLGFAGACLHMLNHAVFKSLLFLNAGAVLQATGTAELDRLGGLLRRMPWTGNAFLAGALAICALPPGNGWISELLLFLGGLAPLYTLIDPANSTACTAGLVTVTVLALTGGLAIACFVRTFGLVFLGEPRQAAAAAAVEAAPALRTPLLLLAALCFTLGLSAPWLLRAMLPACHLLTRQTDSAAEILEHIAPLTATMQTVSLLAAGVLLLALLLASLRRDLLCRREVTKSVTWDCGYAAPTPRMQYSTSSFAQPLLRLAGAILIARRRFLPPRGLFPAQSAFASETPDFYEERLYRPLFRNLENLLGRIQWIQHGRLNFYILAIVLTLLTLLVWKMR